MLADYENIDKILASQPLIIYKRWKKILDVYFSEQNIIPNYYCITDDARTCFLWAQNNMGIAIVPQSIISDQVDYSDELICKKTDGNGHRSVTDRNSGFPHGVYLHRLTAGSTGCNITVIKAN